VTVSELLAGVSATGLYAPYTASGTIVVNDILASTYATIGDNKGILSRDSQAGLHLAQTHHRFLCQYIVSDWCRRETYSDDTGLSPISAMSLKIYEYVVDPETLTVVKWGLSTIIVIGLVLLWTLELTGNNVPMTFLLLMMAVYYWRVKKYDLRRLCSNPKYIETKGGYITTSLT
jgi:Hint module